MIKKTKTTQVQLRMRDDFLARIDATAQKLSQGAITNVTRSHIIRVAIEQFLDGLDKQKK